MKVPNFLPEKSKHKGTGTLCTRLKKQPFVHFFAEIFGGNGKNTYICAQSSCPLVHVPDGHQHHELHGFRTILREIPRHNWRGIFL